MVERVPNEIKMVAWFMAAKNVIKFANDDTTYKLGEAVIKASNFEKFPLNKGDKVEVGIKEGVVTFLRKQKSEAPKNGSEEAYEPTAEEEAPKVAPAPKVEAPVGKPVENAENLSLEELTVFAVAANKKVVKFLELKDSGWFQISDEIQKMDYPTIGLVAKSKVKVAKWDGKTIVSLAKVASEPAEQPKTATSSPANAKVEPMAGSAVQTPNVAPAVKKEWKPAPQYNDDRQKSIEAQASVNSACEVAGQVAAAITTASKKEDGSTNAPTANVINNIIRSIAESNFALIQELKKKQ